MTKFEFIGNHEGKLTGCYGSKDGVTFCEDCIFSGCESMEEDELLSLSDVSTQVSLMGQKDIQRR